MLLLTDSFPVYNDDDCFGHQSFKTLDSDYIDNNYSSSAKGYQLQITPNPVTNEAVINYYLPKGSKGKLVLYDLLGKQKAGFNLTDSYGQVKLSAKDFAPGIYFYKLILNDRIVELNKLIVTQ